MKMPDKLAPHLVAPCGVNCAACYKYLERKKPCPGCLMPGPGQKPAHCRRCHIKDCAQKRAVTHCAWCEEFPCKMVKSLEKTYRTRYAVSLIQNGALMKEDGLKKFLERERETWICPICGGVVSQHDKACSECGQPGGPAVKEPK